jgi:hypothetical protein
VKAAESQQALVLDGPFDGFAAGEIHGLSESGREVDIPLLAGFAFDELNFGREPHGEWPPGLEYSWSHLVI